MPQDIQSFSDVTAIDTRNQLEVELRIRKHGHTVSDITLNSTQVHWAQYVGYWDLFDAINLQVDLTEFTEGVSGVEIEYFGVNGLEVLPKYQHLASNSACYIDKLGIWKMDVPSNFYAWYHAISGQGFIT